MGGALFVAPPLPSPLLLPLGLPLGLLLAAVLFSRTAFKAVSVLAVRVLLAQTRWWSADDLSLRLRAADNASAEITA